MIQKTETMFIIVLSLAILSMTAAMPEPQKRDENKVSTRPNKNIYNNKEDGDKLYIKKSDLKRRLAEVGSTLAHQDKEPEETGRKRIFSTLGGLLYDGLIALLSKNKPNSCTCDDQNAPTNAGMPNYDSFAAFYLHDI